MVSSGADTGVERRRTCGPSASSWVSPHGRAGPVVHAGRMKIRAIAVAGAAALVLAACSGGSKDSGDPEPSQRDAAEIVQPSPLTGLKMQSRPTNPVFVVKIENTVGGQPQLALDQADLVVEELVEGGLTRLAAMYYSKIPAKVGHVRSLRATDIGIASPINGVVVASGGAGSAVRLVDRAGIKVFSEDGGAPGFSSDPTKVRPYNRLIDLKTLAAEAAKAPGPEQPFLSWGDEGAAAEPGTSKTSTATTASVRFSRSVTTNWKLDGEQKWVRTNGHALKEFRADNLIIMFCPIGDAGYLDPAGNPVPVTELEGSGEAYVIRGENVVQLTWKKPAIDSSISFETADGQPYKITPGHSFLELVPKGDGKVTLK